MGLHLLAPRLAGIAFLEACPHEAGLYRKIFRHAGLRSCGSHCCIGRALQGSVTELESGKP